MYNIYNPLFAGSENDRLSWKNFKGKRFGIENILLGRYESKMKCETTEEFFKVLHAPII